MSSLIKITRGEVTVTMEAEEFHRTDGQTVVHHPFRDLLEATLAVIRATGRTDYADEVKNALERDGWEGLE
jgi:predicted RNA binding protein YcfA (HicA-like mRNA interferase family)